MAYVTQHGVGEALFLNEFALFFGGVSTGADNLDTLLFEFLEFITESLTFDGSAGGTGFREEPQYDLSAPEVLQGNQILIGVRQREVRSGHTWI
jgi:hypothetical protein